MSKRRDIERHIRGLGEMKEIMSAMKNLALMETHKLARFIATQHRVVANIREAAEDFLSFHPRLLAQDAAPRDVILLIGSERGFCGDYNEALARALAARTARPDDPALAVVGSKLSARLPDDPRVVVRLEGPDTLEEVQSILLRLVEALNRWQAAQASARPLRLTVLHHEPGEAAVRVTALSPFAGGRAAGRPAGYAALLNLDPRVFLAQLADHYLFAALNEIFYGSLMAENQRRMQHMDSAVRRIEQQSDELLRKRNGLRQEEITEEIEIIMLNAEMLGETGASARRSPELAGDTTAQGHDAAGSDPGPR